MALQFRKMKLLIISRNALPNKRWIRLVECFQEDHTFVIYSISCTTFSSIQEQRRGRSSRLFPLRCLILASLTTWQTNLPDLLYQSSEHWIQNPVLSVKFMDNLPDNHHVETTCYVLLPSIGLQAMLEVHFPRSYDIYHRWSYHQLTHYYPSEIQAR